MDTSSIAVDTAIGQIRMHYRALGLKLPRKLTDGLDRIDQQKRRPVTSKPDPVVLRDAVDACLERGEDPVDDPTVQRELLRRQLVGANVYGMLQDLGDQRRAALLREHSAGILADLATVVAEADTALTQARARIPDLDLTTPTQATVLPPGQMSVWGYARDAADNCKRVTQVWHQVVQSCHLARQAGNRMPMILADLTPEQFSRLNEADVMAPVHAGHRLSLATPAEYVDRCKRIDDYHAELAEQRRQYERTGMREGRVATL
jgi:hypothetical protein